MQVLGLRPPVIAYRRYMTHLVKNDRNQTCIILVIGVAVIARSALRIAGYANDRPIKELFENARSPSFDRPILRHRSRTRAGR